MHNTVRATSMAIGLTLASATHAAACTSSPLANPQTVQSSIVQSGGVTAFYSTLTDRYAHGVLGDALEPTRLHVLTANSSAQCGLRTSVEAPLVFEDSAPRLADITGDGQLEAITVRSHARKGGQIAVYAQDGTKLKLIATTPHIGQSNRWRAPIGAADLDGDGHMDIAEIDRPHLAKTLRIWRYKDGALTQIASAKGFTNHRIGERDIAGGIRDCGQGPEMIVASANWSSLHALRFDGTTITAKTLGSDTSRAAFKRALSC